MTKKDDLITEKHQRTEKHQKPIVFNEKTNMIYVPTPKNISVINGAENNKVNDTFSVEGIEGVEDMIIDQEANMIYALGYNSISIINGTDEDQGIDNFELPTEKIGVTSFNPVNKHDIRRSIKRNLLRFCSHCQIPTNKTQQLFQFPKRAFLLDY